MDGKPVLHTVETHTHFKDAIPFMIKRADEIWYEFWRDGLHIRWLSGLHEAGKGSYTSFKSDAFQSAAEAHGIETKLSGIESHNSIGVGDRYLGPLRRAIRITRQKYPFLDSEGNLRYVGK